MGATFQFGYLPGLNERLRQRAEYTCTVLGLNREVLVEARRDAFGSYRSRALARESYAASAAVDEAPYGFSRRLSVSAGCI